MDNDRSPETFSSARPALLRGRHAIRPRIPAPVRLIWLRKVVRLNRSFDRLSKCRSAMRGREIFPNGMRGLEQRRRARLSNRTNQADDSFAIANRARWQYFPKAGLRDAVLPFLLVE